MPRLTTKDIPPPQGPAASPPTIRPDDFENFPAFRETFLVFFTDPVANEAFRTVGRVLHEFVLEFWGYWPSHREGIFRAELRAAAADLRHLQGALQEWTGPAVAHEGKDDVRLAKLGAEVALGVSELAGRLEVALGALEADA